jgi:hypothetical protein
MMFKVLVIQTTNNLSDERTEFLINDRLSFMRFLGLASLRAILRNSASLDSSQDGSSLSPR